MSTLLKLFANMPPITKVVVLLLGLAGIGGMIWLFGGTAAIFVVIGGLVLIVALMWAYEGVLGMMARKKAAPMLRSISANAAATPSSITAPARRARLDDLRKNFDTGIDKFRAAGKNLYALPWYVLVGEPGSGKTEAIRHCNVGFPPGLQDQLQGAGGTLNMNWWFTNHAVILDTAGRLLFDEVEPGTTDEWQEFLKLLKRNRPHCPINGMLLAIPAESLIKDTADVLEKKAGRIAEQLDSIQRALGVRFPVFVLITKSDLINGFREFFDEITDPALQHQMMGWTNPAPLDAPFNPELIGEHLRTVQRRLAKRRAGLLQDPINTENAGRSRADQVDALYAFPDAMVRIGPRLQRYLGMIFTAGEWAQAPLFLRGIYFTSSMREGAALDQELAEAFGVSLESLPEGKVWERDRAYFLRDLFVSKVFKEKGLVTRAESTKAQLRARNTLVYGLGGVGLVLLAALTWYGATGLGKTVAGPTEFWGAASQAYLNEATMVKANPALGLSEHWLPIVSRPTAASDEWYYRGGLVTDPNVPDPLRAVPMDPQHRSRAGMAAELARRAREEIRTPAVFRPVAAIVGGSGTNLVGEKRLAAARAIFEAGVLRPLVDACKINLKKDAEARAKWPEAAAAEAQVRAIGESMNGPTPPAIDFGALLRYALRGTNDFADKKVVGDLPGIEEGYRALYVEPGVWPPASMKDSYRVVVPGGAMPAPPVGAPTPVPAPAPAPTPTTTPTPPVATPAGAPMKFPLAPFTSAAAEMTLDDVNALRDRVEQAKAGGAVPAELRKAEAMLRALPRPPTRARQMCTLTVLPEEPASLGKTGLAGDASFVGIAPVGAKSGRPMAMAGKPDVKLARLPGPGEPFEIRFFETEAGGEPRATIRVPSVWGAMWLVDKFGGQPARAGDRTIWDVEAEVATRDGPRSVWVRLEFDAELPELPWYP
ncbi:MAG TPA: type VI secretion protein IcmF/TssM N-terminal domain-containing protein [Phycisphaerales bacterium]|nr:type VI secretion protein IcmF/TssM N-terminal domain-containing protein [Phycisphaerales bacterium]